MDVDVNVYVHIMHTYRHVHSCVLLLTVSWDSPVRRKGAKDLILGCPESLSALATNHYG